MFAKNKYMLGDDFSMLDVAIAPLLWRLDYYGIDMSQERGAADEVRRAHLLAPGLHRGADAVREGDAQVSCEAAHAVAASHQRARVTSTRPYLIRALYEWCTDNGFTPYLAVKVDEHVQVPREYVKNGEIVLNISFDATSSLKLGNELIEFKARFGGTAREIAVPVDRVIAIYARENGQGMAFPAPVPAATSAASASTPRRLRRKAPRACRCAMPRAAPRATPARSFTW